MNKSHYVYNNLLRSAIPPQYFSEQLMMLLDYDPYYMPAYLELVWYAERDGDIDGKKKILKQASKRVDEILINKVLLNLLVKHWGKLEFDSFHEILVFLIQNQKNKLHKLKYYLLKNKIQNFCLIKNNHWYTPSVYLQKEAEAAVDEFKREIDSLEPYWWLLNSSRSKIAHHQHTQTIVVRHLLENNEEYTPFDGVHESVPSNCWYKFKRLHQYLLQFANDKKLGLGRVAIVKMSPGCQSYRHYDSEFFLKNRKRYHLVLQAGDNNILSSGVESVSAKTGEVWFFENHCMHRAHNLSKIPRIHVIFDGYPLEN